MWFYTKDVDPGLYGLHSGSEMFMGYNVIFTIPIILYILSPALEYDPIGGLSEYMDCESGGAWFLMLLVFERAMKGLLFPLRS